MGRCVALRICSVWFSSRDQIKEMRILKSFLCSIDTSDCSIDMISRQLQAHKAYLEKPGTYRTEHKAVLRFNADCHVQSETQLTGENREIRSLAKDTSRISQQLLRPHFSSCEDDTVQELAGNKHLSKESEKCRPRTPKAVFQPIQSPSHVSPAGKRDVYQPLHCPISLIDPLELP